MYQQYSVEFPEEPPIGSVVLCDGIAAQLKPGGLWNMSSRSVPWESINFTWKSLFSNFTSVVLIYVRETK